MRATHLLRRAGGVLGAPGLVGRSFAAAKSRALRAPCVFALSDSGKPPPGALQCIARRSPGLGLPKGPGAIPFPPQAAPPGKFEPGRIPSPAPLAPRSRAYFATWPSRRFGRATVARTSRAQRGLRRRPSNHRCFCSIVQLRFIGVGRCPFSFPLTFHFGIPIGFPFGLWLFCWCWFGR